MLLEQDKLYFRLWSCKQEPGIQSKAQNSMLKTNLPIKKGYKKKKPNKQMVCILWQGFQEILQQLCGT